MALKRDCESFGRMANMPAKRSALIWVLVLRRFFFGLGSSESSAVSSSKESSSSCDNPLPMNFTSTLQRMTACNKGWDVPSNGCLRTV